jgi:ABC-type transport system involved in cytochrome bd biosynthesis fused ATPase/permease subunit
LEKQFKGSLPLEVFDWQVGVIVGRSGSGKTSIAKQLFTEAYIKGFSKIGDKSASILKVDPVIISMFSLRMYPFVFSLSKTPLFSFSM